MEQLNTGDALLPEKHAEANLELFEELVEIITKPYIGQPINTETHHQLRMDFRGAFGPDDILNGMLVFQDNEHEYTIGRPIADRQLMKFTPPGAMDSEVGDALEEAIDRLENPPPDVGIIDLPDYGL